MLQVPSSDAVPASLWTADYGSEDGIPCKMLILSEFLKYAQFDIEGNHSCFAGLHAQSLPPASPCLLQLPTPPSRLPSPTCQVDWNSLQPGQKLVLDHADDQTFSWHYFRWRHPSVMFPFSRYYEGPPPTYRGRDESRSRWARLLKTLQRGRGEEISLLCSYMCRLSFIFAAQVGLP